LFIINEFSSFLKFFSLITVCFTNDNIKVHKEVVTWISKAKCTACVIGSHNSLKSNSVRFMTKFYFSIYLYRVFRATTFLELALFLYCWLVFVIYTLRQKCLVLWDFEAYPDFVLKFILFESQIESVGLDPFCSVTNYLLSLETFRDWPKMLYLN